MALWGWCTKIYYQLADHLIFYNRTLCMQEGRILLGGCECLPKDIVNINKAPKYGRLLWWIWGELDPFGHDILGKFSMHLSLREVSWNKYTYQQLYLEWSLINPNTYILWKVIQIESVAIGPGKTLIKKENRGLEMKRWHGNTDVDRVTTVHVPPWVVLIIAKFCMVVLPPPPHTHTQGGYAYTFVGLSVCLGARLRRNDWMESDENFSKGPKWHRE